MANEALLRDIVESRADITSAVIISKGKAAETHSRSGALTPPDADLKRMVLQTELLVGMIMTNERVVGETRFIMISHADINALIVPAKTGKILVLVFTDLRDVEGLARNALQQARRVA